MHKLIETALITIPLLRPQLPDVRALTPWLERIDSNRYYTNFGVLHDEFLAQLLALQRSSDDGPIHGVLTSSATAGLELAISNLGLPTGSRIAVPALTFPATATAVQRSGHVPVPVDVDPNSWLLMPSHLPPELLKRHGIRAVLPVATFGVPQDELAWRDWSRLHSIPVIVDAAAAIGAQEICDGITFVFSLHATKALSCGEGGLIVTQNLDLAERLRAMTNFGIGLQVPALGTNAKLSEYHAAVGLAHVAIWPEQAAGRMALLERFKDALLPDLARSLRFQQSTGLVAPSLVCLQVADPGLRARLEAACAEGGIQTRRWYLPLLQNQPMIHRLENLLPTPNADWLSQTLLGLPFFLGMTDQEFDRVVTVVLEETLRALGKDLSWPVENITKLTKSNL